MSIAHDIPVSGNGTTVFVRCSCQHEYQDKTYGPGIRVANKKGKSKGTATEYRCTVCGNTHER